MVVERSELRLVWPADLFAREAQALLDAGADDPDRMGWLLAEAFHGDRGLKLYRELDAVSPHPAGIDDPWGSAANGYRAEERERLTVLLLRDLIADLDRLPRYAPKRYYSARRAPRPEPVLSPAEARAAWAREVTRLARTGYFEDAFGSSCGDAREDPSAEGQRHLAELLDVDAPLWPLEHWVDGEGVVPTGAEHAWPEELFFDVVEALHDVVARPRRRSWHRYCEDWDYFDFARAPGQAVYRWRVNAVLARSEIGLRLAEGGEETGLLVNVTGDDRDQLAARVIEVEAEQGVRAHAVAKFRGRVAGVPEKRSAIVDLAGLLENRRSLLKAELLRKDEGALFDIANNFDLRHRDAKQRTDYDEAFLDWLFWWYLGTLDLTDRLLARQDRSAAAAGS